MDHDPFKSPQASEPPEPPTIQPQTKATGREGSNRAAGLGAYAMAIVMCGVIIVGAYDEIHQRGFSGLLASIKKDPTPLGIMVAAAVIFWAIGITTGRRPKPPATRS